MKFNISHIVPLASLVFLTSCFKEDDPIPPYVSPPGVNTVVAETRPDYSLQSYYDFSTNTFVSSNHREDWDFAFSCSPAVTAVYLNSSKRMRVLDTQSDDWSVPFSPTAQTNQWRFDESTGEPENTALFGFVPGRVYVMDLGLSVTGTNLGFRKIKIVSSDLQSLIFEYAMPDGSQVQNATLTKNSEYNFVYFSFKNGGEIVTPEPKKNRYDIQFTHYTTRVYYEGSTTDFEWYAVNGVLLNPTGVTVAVDSTDNFGGITFDELSQFSFSSQRDFIGYDWKSYDFDLATYKILSQNTYLIRDRFGDFWKMRFVSFTNALGERGYPTFEVAKF